MKKLLYLIIIAVSCSPVQQQDKSESNGQGVELVVLGIAQDAGAPHIGCQANCCQNLRSLEKKLQVVSLGIIDHKLKQTYLLEASPDITAQLKDLQDYLSFEHDELPDGIVLSHAHIGHYTGLMYLGKEAKGAKNVPVFALPRMDSFLRSNGPWSQLVEQKNILLKPIYHEEPLFVSANLQITPLLVPHRDEFSETAGFLIKGPNNTIAFIPDIDKWEKWSIELKSILATVDIAMVDGTFYSGEELNNRDMRLVPHPSIQETMKTLDSCSLELKSKLYFIHLNHTNPVLNSNSEASLEVREQGFKVARSGMRFQL